MYSDVLTEVFSLSFVHPGYGKLLVRTEKRQTLFICGQIVLTALLYSVLTEDQNEAAGSQFTVGENGSNGLSQRKLVM